MRPAKSLSLIILISIVILWVYVCFAETGIEEIEINLSNQKGEKLLHSYKTLATRLRENSPEQSLKYTDKILELLTTQNLRFKKQTLKEYLIFAHYNLGWCLQLQGSYLKAVENFYRGLLQSTDSELRFSILFQIGKSYQLAGYHEESLKYYQQALNMESDNFGNRYYSQLLRNMIEVLRNEGEHAESLKFYKKLCNWEESQGDEKSYERKEFRWLIDKGRLSEIKSDYQQAQSHYEGALKSANTVEEKSEIYQLLGELFAGKDYKKSMQYYRLSLQELSYNDHKYQLAFLLKKMINAALQNWTIAEKSEIRDLIKIRCNLAEELHEYDLLAECSLMRKEYYTQSNDLEEAYWMSKQYYLWQDSLRVSTEQIKLAKMKDLITHKELLGQLELVSKENARRELQLTRDKLLTDVLIGLMLILAVIWLMLYIYYRSRKKYMRKLKDVNKQIYSTTEQLKLRIKELEEFKISLKDRYRKAIDEAKWKDNILIIQSRYVALSDMIENISIQWKTNLDKVKINADRVIALYREGNISEERLSDIVHDSMIILQNMSNKIDDFRDFFRPYVSTSDFRAMDVIRKVRDFVIDYYQNYRIQIMLVENSEVIIKDGFPNEFALVILNIFNNSREAFESSAVDHPQIVVTVDESYDRKAIEITDNAGGISPEIKNRIFDPFFSTRKHRNACGLGLYIVKEIIENKNCGKVTVENQQEGTSVKIIF